MDLVAEEFGSKEPSEVLNYSKVFIQRFSELKNSDKILQQIGKSKLQKYNSFLLQIPLYLFFFQVKKNE